MIFTRKVSLDLINQSNFNQPVRYAVCISLYGSRSIVYFTGILSNMYIYEWYLFKIDISTC